MQSAIPSCCSTRTKRIQARIMFVSKSVTTIAALLFGTFVLNAQASPAPPAGKSLPLVRLKRSRPASHDAEPMLPHVFACLTHRIDHREGRRAQP